MNNNNKEFIEKLDKEINTLMENLRNMDPACDDYKIVSNNLKTILEAKEAYHKAELKRIETEIKDDESDLRQMQIDSEIEAKRNEIEARKKESELRQKLLETEIQAKVDEMNKLNEDVPLWKKIDPNVVIKGAVGIAAVVLVLKHEKLEVIASKAFGLLPRLLC